MRSVAYILIFGLILSFSGISYCEDVEREKKSSSGGNELLTGALMGGLLGGGLGAAIGSASGHAGTGAAIGAGVGALGGSVVGASQASKREEAERENAAIEEQETSAPPKGAKIKKKIIREYDEQGNVISEREVKN